MGTLGGIPLEVGDVLAKKYRLDGLVGEGGTGLVIAARHLQLDQRVAIKFLRTALSNEEIRLRFEREARAIEKISSDHVVLLYDVGTLDDGEPYMVMEYLEGRDLQRVLKEEGKLPLGDAVDCMLQVCEALAEAHQYGIVHRDLKPANLFLTRVADGAPFIKVVDFGISKFLDPKLLDEKKDRLEVTNQFTVLGSPRFMAPEQLRSSKDVDHRADLWSVGAVLFQLVTGRHAFNAETNVQASLRVLTVEPDRLCAHAPDAPPELEAIVARCLVKDREKRWQSAAELSDALAPFASARAREGIEHSRAARSAPNLMVAMGVASVVPPSEEKLERVDPVPASAPTTILTTEPRVRVPTPRTPLRPRKVERTEIIGPPTPGPQRRPPIDAVVGPPTPAPMPRPQVQMPPPSHPMPPASHPVPMSRPMPMSQPIPSSHPISSRPMPVPAPLPPKPGVRPLRIVAAAVTVVAVLSVALFGIVMARRAANARPKSNAIVPLDAAAASP